MSNTIIKINKSLNKSDPQNHPVLIIGQLRHLSILQFQHVECKLAPRVSADLFQNAITCLHPSPTDFCPLYLNLATIAALPIKCSRHNTPSRAHAITRLVKTHTMNVSETVLVCINIIHNSSFYFAKILMNVKNPYSQKIHTFYLIVAQSSIYDVKYIFRLADIHKVVRRMYKQ